MQNATPHSIAFEGGFADPVRGAQSVFRAVMDAMARPGSIHEVADLCTPPAPLTASAAAIISTLADAETPVWLDPPLAHSEAVRDWIVFHTGAAVTTHQDEAGFALVAAPQGLAALNGFSLGTQEYPDRSTTLILQVSDMAAGETLVLEGPGVKVTTSIAPAPMPPHFAAQWRDNRAGFPRGVDLILAGPGCVAALPRTTRLVQREA